MSMDVVLQQIPALDPVHLFKEGTGTVLKDIASFARSVDFDPTTPEGRELGKSIAYKCARAKTMIDEMGKTLVADIKKQSGAIDAERKKVRDTLDALRDEIRKPIDEWEAAEAVAIEAQEAALKNIHALGEIPLGQDLTVEQIDNRLGTLSSLTGATTWRTEEYVNKAQAIILNVTERLTEARGTAVRRAAEYAELEELRAAERRRQAEEGEKRLAEEADARAEQDAKRWAENEAARVFAELHNKAWAENMALDAAARAVIEERMRVAGEEALAREAETKREANKRHRAEIHNAARKAIMVAFKAAAERNDHDLAKAVVEAIVRGDIPNVKITY